MPKKETFFILTVVFIISAVANGFIQDQFSHVVTIVFSILASICLAATIVLYAKDNK